MHNTTALEGRKALTGATVKQEKPRTCFLLPCYEISVQGKAYAGSEPLVIN